MLHQTGLQTYGFTELEPFDSTSRQEYEANLFAAELLLEDDVAFEKLHHENRSYIEIAQEMGVPIKLMQFKLRMLNSKGFIMMDLPTTTAAFLKEDIGEYEPWY